MTTIERVFRTVIVGCLGLAPAACREGLIETERAQLAAIEAQPFSSDAGLTIDSRGGVLLSWIGGDSSVPALYVARSADSGRTWSAAVRVAGGGSAPGEVHPHGESSPRLVAGPGEEVAIAWANSVPAPTRKWPAAMMRFSRSGDGGKSWSAPMTLNDDTTSAPVGHQFHGAAWSGDSGILVAWLDERASGGMPREAPGAAADPHGHGASEPDATIYLASSPDFGRTWGPNRPLWGAACPCCRVSLARAADGGVLSTWRKHYPGDVRDVVVAPIGADSSGVKRIYDDEWVYPGCPHAGPAISTNASGTHVVWYTGKPGGAGVFYSRPGERAGGAAVALLERRTLPPAHVAVAALAGGGAIAAYDVDGSGKRAVTVSWISPDGVVRSQQRVRGSEQGSYPQVVALGKDTALLAWTGTEGSGARIRVVRVRLAGR